MVNLRGSPVTCVFRGHGLGDGQVGFGPENGRRRGPVVVGSGSVVAEVTVAVFVISGPVYRSWPTALLILTTRRRVDGNVEADGGFVSGVQGPALSRGRASANAEYRSAGGGVELGRVVPGLVGLRARARANDDRQAVGDVGGIGRHLVLDLRSHRRVSAGVRLVDGVLELVAHLGRVVAAQVNHCLRHRRERGREQVDGGGEHARVVLVAASGEGGRGRGGAVADDAGGIGRGYVETEVVGVAALGALLPGGFQAVTLTPRLEMALSKKLLAGRTAVVRAVLLSLKVSPVIPESPS